MKTFFKLAACLVLLLSTSYAYANKTVPSKIEHVTVYRQGAVVMRSGNVNIPSGRSVLTFTELPNTINPQSVQFSADGDFTILSIQHQVNHLTPPPPNKAIHQLEQDKKRFNLDLQREQTLLSVAQDEENIILMAGPMISNNKDSFSINHLKDAADLYRERLRNVKLEKLGITQQIAVLQDTIQKITSELKKLKTQSKRETINEVLVTIDAPRAINSNFELSYQVSRASWTPLYDVKVANTSQPVSLAYKAKVQQHSGEDWDNAFLTLSTGNPTSFSLPPVMNPWWLNIYTPQNVYADDESYDRMEQPQKEVLDEVVVTSYAAPPVVQAVDQVISFQFEIKARYDIPSKGKDYVVQIGKYDLPADYEYYAAPKLNPYAYLTAKISDWENYRLLPGTANLYFNGTYLGQSAINPNVATDTMSFSLGKDESISITRKKGKKYSERQFIGNKQMKTIAWDIEIRNNKRQNIDIVIEDQYPVSANEQIEVELLQSKGANVDESQGKLRWEFSLKPGKRKELSFGYEVKYPKVMTLALE